MSTYELLSPAGDMESLRASIRYGADAVYLGGPRLQLRADKAGFSMESLEEAVKFAHSRGKKIYVTVNSYAGSEEIDELPAYASALDDIGVDALIVSDLGAIATIRREVPSIPVHVSTQASCMNYASAMVYRSMGAERIVLAREMSLKGIKELRRRLPDDTELEAFVHGAMCMAYSGRCIISSYMAGRSGNRGECTQPCRWRYHLYEESRPGEFYPLEESETGTRILSSHDLKMLEHLEEMKDAGIVSFKIEGRMKTAYYAATVTNAYRQALDGSTDIKVLQRELEAVSHRPYSTGFYYGDERESCYNSGVYVRGCTFVGVVLGSEGSLTKVQQRNHFRKGETLELVSPGKAPVSFKVETLISSEGLPSETAPHPMEEVTMNCPEGASPGDMIRRWEDEEEKES